MRSVVLSISKILFQIVVFGCSRITIIVVIRETQFSFICLKLDIDDIYNSIVQFRKYAFNDAKNAMTTFS